MAPTELWGPTLLSIIPLCQFSSNFHFIVTVWHHRQRISEEIAVFRVSWHESVLAALLTFYPCHGTLFLSIQWIQCSQATKACSLCRGPPAEMKKRNGPRLWQRDASFPSVCRTSVLWHLCGGWRTTLHVGSLSLLCLRLASFAVACSRLVGSLASRSLLSLPSLFQNTTITDMCSIWLYVAPGESELRSLCWVARTLSMSPYPLA